MNNYSAYSSFGEACRKARLKKGWTYLQAMMNINNLCEKRDKPICTERSLIKWEQGQGLPKIEPTKAMAIVYDAPELIKFRLECIEFIKTNSACAGTQTLYGKN